jgi:acetyl-CoA synthetase
LKGHLAKKIGAIDQPDEILFAAELPKTRRGKIMRRLLRDIADGRTLGAIRRLWLILRWWQS